MPRSSTIPVVAVTLLVAVLVFAGGAVVPPENGGGFGTPRELAVGTVATGAATGGFSVSFDETGLVLGTNWSVTLNGSTNSSSGSVVTFTEPNGSYAYAVGSVAGFTAVPSGGNVTVAGTAVVVNVTFRPTYEVTFLETGLAAGTNWSVTVNGTSIASNGTYANFTEPNGTYAFTVGTPSGYSASPASGTVTVSGAPVNQSVTFGPLTASTFVVTFGESGLPAGTNWSVDLNGTTTPTSGATVAFSLPNGTYPFTVVPPPGYGATPSSGTVTVAGASVNETITFAPSAVTTYNVTFTETGLPSGTGWSVTVNGTGNGSTTPTVSFRLPNGSYAFSINPVAGYAVSPASGSVTVNGGPASQAVTFTSGPLATYSITFVETGLPPGTNWSVTLNGTTNASTTTSIGFREPNGSFGFAIGSVDGLAPNLTSGNVIVHGRPVSDGVAFSAPKGASGLLGLPGAEGYLVVGGMVFLLLIVIAAVGARIRARRQHDLFAELERPRKSSPRR